MKLTNSLFMASGIITVFGVLTLIVTARMGDNEVENNKILQTTTSTIPTLIPTSIPVIPSSTANLSPTKKELIEHDVLLDVPFVVQAPRHNWNDLLYQNACEEASILMAMRWVEGRSLTNEEAYVEIKKLSDYSQEKYGFHLDQSAEDVTRLARDYYSYQGIEYRKEIEISDIKNELMKGNVVLVPVNGKKLNNPFFTPPGPVEHMLVIRGYNVSKKEFITNDSGVGKGNGYRYKEEVLSNALQEYPTGYHEPISKIKKVMIVISK